MRRQTAIGRYNAVLIALLVIALLFAGRLVYVQAVEGGELARDALDSRLWHSTIEAPRGEILDTDGQVLAGSVRRYNIGVNQQKISDFTTDINGQTKHGAVAAAELLAPLLERDPADLGAELVGDSTFVYLARGVTPEKWREINELEIPGIEPEPVTQRTYPNGAVAGNVLGFVGRDGEGMAGLELTKEERLAGEPGTTVAEVGLHGQLIPAGRSETTPAQPGETLQTTIDRDLQFHTEQVVEDYTDRFDAAWGAAIIQEIDTGNLLSVVDSASVDPGDYQASAPEDQGSRAVQASFEPGSTGKVATIAAALDSGAVEPTTSFTTPDEFTTDSGQHFSDADPHPTEDMTVAGILATSSNTGTIMVGEEMSDAERYDYYRSFGLGETSGIGLPGEASGVLEPHEDWDGRQRYTTMFGQGLSVSLLQNTSIMATIANDGIRVPPRLVAGSVDDNDTLKPAPEGDERRVISEETASQMMTMMESVVSEEGTGVLAELDGYRMAGKTGTAQVPDAEGRLTQTVTNFMAAVPAEDPQLAITVMLYHPGNQLPSSMTSAPATREIAAFAVQHLGIPPSRGEPDPYPLRAE